MLFPQEKYPTIPSPNIINSMAVSGYAPYLRRLGLRLKRRAVPRAPSRTLRFSEVQGTPEDPKFAFEVVVSIETDRPISAGYIVVEFDGQWATVGTDFEGGKDIFPNMESIDNKEFLDYLTKRKFVHMYAFGIGKNPFVPEKPIRVVAAGGILVHVTRVIFFEE